MDDAGWAPRAESDSAPPAVPLVDLQGPGPDTEAAPSPDGLADPAPAEAVPAPRHRRQELAGPTADHATDSRTADPGTADLEPALGLELDDVKEAATAVAAERMLAQLARAESVVGGTRIGALLRVNGMTERNRALVLAAGGGAALLILFFVGLTLIGLIF